MADWQQVVESVPTEFDYFEPRVVQAAITNEFYQSFCPITSLQQGAPIEFVVPSADNQYLDLSNSKLEIKCKITNADGTDIDRGANVGPTNLLLHSMFKSVDMEINNKQITEPSTLYALRSFLETSLTFSEQVGKTRLVAEGWVKDHGTGDDLDDFRRADSPNTGFKTRAAKFAQSSVVTLIGRPHLDLFHQDKDLPPNCSIKLRLLPHENGFSLNRPDGGGNPLYRLRIVSARLFVRTKEVSPSFALAHVAMLQKHNIRIPYTKVALKSITIANGTTNYQHDGLYMGQLPERIIIGLIADNRLNGTYHLNPFRFQNFGLGFMALQVNGEQIPRVAYEPNFTTGDYIRDYLGLYEGLGLDIGNNTIDVTPEQWANDLPLFVFRLSPGGLPSVPKTGNIRVELKFRTPLAANILLLCFAEYSSVLEIDRAHNVLTI